METEAKVEASPEAAAEAASSPEAAIYDHADEANGTAAPGGAAHLDAELARLREELANAKTLADDNQRKYLLALADLDNFKKRAEKLAADRLAYAKKATIGKFLPVLDNLQRALAYEQDSEGLRGGLNATMRGFESLLSSESVTALSLVGAPFDPRTAEAITTRDSAEHDDDVVLEEVERGYQLGDELLRPAKVIVSRRVEAAS